jgi:hypothetical protein
MEQKYKPKAIYKDYKDDLLGQINKRQIRPTPLTTYVPKAFPIIHHPLDYMKPKAFKQEHHTLNIDKFKGHDLERKHTNDLDEQINKPLTGVETKEIPDAKNIAHYQFRLQGKTDADVSLANLSKDPTQLGNLIENAETGESLDTIKKLQNKTEDLATARGNFVKMFKEKFKKKEIKSNDVIIGLENVEKNYDAIEPIRVQRKIQLKPVKPIEHSIAIPITDEDEKTFEKPKRRGKRGRMSKAELDAYRQSPPTPSLASPDENENIIDAILGKLDRDMNLNKLIKSGDIVLPILMEDLKNTSSETASVMINKFTKESLLKLLNSKNVSVKGLKTKAQFQDALYKELGLTNPEIGTVLEKVGRIEKRGKKGKANV